MDGRREAAAELAIRASAHELGVWDETPVAMATAKAAVALRHGATMVEACDVAHRFLASWQRHPANGRRLRLIA
ncbi:MAG TPA: hypothetical protein VFJ85_02145 [Acidimicrobiales bacterium]|nr:hypothetical protein [Acidimicrobiales bacterium]